MKKDDFMNHFINGVKYVDVDRKAKVGEFVVIVKSDPCLVYKKIGEIVEILEVNGETCGILKPYDTGEKGAVYHFQYRTLEPVEKICELCDGTGMLEIDDPNIHMALTTCDCTKSEDMEVDLNNFVDY